MPGTHFASPSLVHTSRVSKLATRRPDTGPSAACCIPTPLLFPCLPLRLSPPTRHFKHAHFSALFTSPSRSSYPLLRPPSSVPLHLLQACPDHRRLPSSAALEYWEVQAKNLVNLCISIVIRSSIFSLHLYTKLSTLSSARSFPLLWTCSILPKRSPSAYSIAVFVLEDLVSIFLGTVVAFDPTVRQPQHLILRQAFLQLRRTT